MNTKSNDEQVGPLPAHREFVELVKNNKAWALLAIVCAADGVFAIIDLSIKPGLLTACTEKLDLKSCQFNRWGVAHLLGWTLGPPLFFFFETVLQRSKFEPTGEPTEDARRKIAADRLKALQDLGGKVWAGVLAAILFLAPK